MLAEHRKLNATLQLKIDAFKKLQQDNNVGIKFEEMNCNDIIRKMVFIEKDPKRIWAAYSNFYSKGFFYPCIEAEFGFKPSSGSIKSFFEAKVRNANEQARRRIEGMQSKFELEAKYYQLDIADKDRKLKLEKQKYERQLRQERDLL